MPQPQTIGYLTSAYARTSDSFIRGEVLALRALGYTVHTFSVNRPGRSELVSDDIRREYENTEYLLDSKGRLLGAGAKELFRRPGRFFSAVRLARKVAWPGIKGRIWPYAYVIEAALLARRLRARGVQHLHNHFGDGTAAVAMLAAQLAGIPYSLTIHGSTEWDKPMVLALHEKVKRAAFVAAVSEYTRSQVCRWSDLADWPKVHVVRCGVGESFLKHPFTPIPAERRLVCVGRLVEQKGLPVLVEAVRRLAGEGLAFEVVLVGDGPMRSLIELQIKQFGLEKHLRIVGSMNAQQVKEQVLNSRGMVLASFAEGLPVVMMESLALGRPVIGTYVAAIPELVEPGACGWLVPPGSADRLTAAMREALTASDERLEQMGREGARRVAERHDISMEAAKLAALISGRPHEPLANRVSRDTGVLPVRETATRRDAVQSEVLSV